jgi:hypothetical protein
VKQKERIRVNNIERKKRGEEKRGTERMTQGDRGRKKNRVNDNRELERDK